MQSSLAIETVSLTKKFRPKKGFLRLSSCGSAAEVTAVDRVSLQVEPGEVFGLLGPNGAGKTTLVKLLSTLLLPSSGSAYLCGHDVVREAHRVKGIIGLIASEERSFFWRLTGRQNIRFFSALYGVQDQTDAWVSELFELFELAEAADVRFNEYSTGMRQKLAIVRGLLNKPKVLFMDEPTKGLDPMSAQDLLGLIRDKVVGLLGRTVLMTTHLLRDVERLCKRVAIMNKGRIMVCGTLGEIRSAVREHERYRLRVHGLSDTTFVTLRQVRGVMDCTRLSQKNGITEISMQTRAGGEALSEALKRLFQERCDVLSCTLEEEGLEEIFGHLMKDRKPAEGT